MRPPWFRLLREQQQGQGITAAGPAPGGRVGLTVPFLIGAIRTPPGTVREPAESRSDLASLLESMRDSSSGRSVVIGECANLLQPRVSLAGGGALGNSGDAVVRDDGSPSNLFAWSQYFARDTRGVESLVEGLWNLLGSAIREGRFSYRAGAWQEFNDDDLAFIQRALRDEDDT